MQMNRNFILRIIPLFALLLLMGAVAPYSLKAQTTTADVGFTPYSLYSFGDIASEGSAYHKSMGGFGIGDRNVMYINMLNPAAVTAREKQSFMFDFGVEQKNTYYAANTIASLPLAMTDNYATTNNNDLIRSAHNSFNMNHIAASFPITQRNSAFKIGIAPYSSVGYRFVQNENDEKILAEVGDVKYHKVGQGGIYQSFLGAGVTLFNRLSLGAEAKYYFGTINRYSSAYFTTSTAYSTLKTGWDYVVRGFSGKFGLQYEQPLGSSTRMVIGATYQLPTSLGGDVTRYAFAAAETSTDTVSFIKTPNSGMSIPQEFGAGISFRNPDKWMVGFDYVRQDWRGTQLEGTPGIDFEPSLSQSFKAGFEITPNRYDIRYFFKRLTYRGGLYRKESYFTLNGNKIYSTGITLGVSIPVFRYYNSVNVGVDFGQRGSLTNNMVRERYFLFTVAFSLHDIWFIKPLYQ